MFTLGESTLSQFLHAHAVKKCLFTQNLHGLEQFCKARRPFMREVYIFFTWTLTIHVFFCLFVLNIDDHEKYFLSTQY